MRGLRRKRGMWRLRSIWCRTLEWRACRGRAFTMMRATALRRYGLRFARRKRLWRRERSGSLVCEAWDSAVTLKRKLVWIAAVVGAPALIVVTATALTPENAHVERRRTRTRIANVRAEVDRGLSEGASVAEVTRFLDIKHWEHSELVRPEAMFTDGRHYDKTPIIQVLFRNTAHS